jgi:hypothetical protein
MEHQMYGNINDTIHVSQELVQQVKRLNAYAKHQLDGLIDFKTQILNNVLSCKMFTLNYPLLIEHILREANLYRSYIVNLENGMGVDDNIKETELFWNQIMMEHAEFIRGLLDPVENTLIVTANDFANQYADLLNQARIASDMTMSTQSALRETMKYRDFKEAGTKGIAECKIRSVILPLLADHVLRESNHYIRLLHQFS